MTRRPRIFISHAANDTVGIGRLRGLTLLLADAGYDVLLDLDNLRPGDRWRREIYTWIGLSDTAIVLVSPRALEPENPWVAREASILMWRQALDPKFRLVPVLLDGLDFSALDQGGFRDLLATEVQACITASDDDSWMHEIVQSLVDQCTTLPNNPLDELVVPLAQNLAHFDRLVLEEAAALLDVDLGPWMPEGDLAKRVGLQMLHLGIEGSSAALDHLALQGVEEDSLGTILELIAPSWVDLCSARCIADAARRREGKQALLLNAKSRFAAEMYIRRASGRPPRTDWPHVVLPGAFGESGADDLERQLREALRMKLRIAHDPLADNDEQRLNTLMQRHQDNGRPIFVVSRYTPGLAMHMAALKARFPALTFLTLSGAHDNRPDLPASFARVMPELRGSEEADAQNAYDYHRSVLGVN